LKVQRQVLNPPALRLPAKRITQSNHSRQRDDNRWNPDVCDQRSIDRSQPRANDTTRQGRGGHRQTGFCQYACGNATDCKYGAYGDIDLACQNDQRHSQRNHHDRNICEEKIAQICARKIARRSNRQDACQHRDCNSNGNFPLVMFQNHLCPNASERMFCCVASSLERTRTMEPSYMTAILSLIPRISGSSDEIIMIATPRSARSIMML